MKIGIKEDAAHKGGINIFGDGFEIITGYCSKIELLKLYSIGKCDIINNK